MKLITSAEHLTQDKKYLCGQLHPNDSNWEVWNVMEWDADEKVFYILSDLFGDETPFGDFKYVYELPSLKDINEI